MKTKHEQTKSAVFGKSAIMKPLAIAGSTLALAGSAMAQTSTTLGEAAADAVDSGIATVTPIIAVLLGFTILVGLIVKFCKR